MTLCACGGSSGSSTTTEQGGERDTDGLEDQIEVEGWDILLDLSGFGAGANGGTLTWRRVTSDPTKNDTDGDGLTDLEEYQIRTDPRRIDTDGDGLTDFEEWHRWQTSPVSVDSDGDARGPQGVSTGVPNALLFDGAELKLGLSPTLADTDGDGQWDAEEIDHRVRSPLLAEIPTAQIVQDGPIDIRLDVVYETGEIRESAYETSTSTSQSTSAARSRSETQETSWEWSVSATVSASTKGGYGASVTATYGQGQMQSETTGLTRESTQATQQTSTRYESDARSRTESSASGQISTGISIRNISTTSSFELGNLGIAVQQLQPRASDGRAQYKTLTVLTPALENVTLSPGESTPTLLVNSKDVNADAIKEFMARPSSLRFAPAYYDLRGSNGVDFDFLSENAFTRTALLYIDFGDGAPEIYRVATNVNRGMGGTFEGITMKQVLTTILEIPYATMSATVEIPDPDVPGATLQVEQSALTSLRGIVGAPSDADPNEDRWIVGGTRPGLIAPGQDFDDIILHAGDEVRLVFKRDTDGDLVPDSVEDLYGSDRERTDTDDDDLSDYDEIFGSWMAGIDPRDPRMRFRADQDLEPYLVRSHPVLPDSDADGLRDDEEKRAGTDPRLADTDRDGVEDRDDLFPVLAAPGRIYVDAEQTVEMPDGRGWDTAFPDLQDALARGAETVNALWAALPANPQPGEPYSLRDAIELARAQNPEEVPDPDNPGEVLTYYRFPATVASDTHLSDEIYDEGAAFVVASEVWVARGTYYPDQGNDVTAGNRRESFQLVDGLRIFGGFLGNEVSRDLRDPDPRTNSTVLSGNIMRDDDLDADAYHVVRCDNSVSRATVLDGFTIQRGHADGTTYPDDRGGGILNLGGWPSFRNLRVASCRALYGAGFFDGPSGGASFKTCSFVSNTAPQSSAGGGGFTMDAATQFDTCVFANNQADVGGGLECRALSSPRTSLVACRFTENRALIGAGLHAQGGQILLDRCRFDANTTNPKNDGGFEDLPNTFFADEDEVDDGMADVIRPLRDRIARFKSQLSGVLASNELRGAGGGAAIEDCDALLRQCFVSGNTASVGGGVYCLGTGDVYVLNCTFVDNGSHAGGADLHGPNQGQLTVRSSILGAGRSLTAPFPSTVETWLDQTNSNPLGWDDDLTIAFTLGGNGHPEEISNKWDSDDGSGTPWLIDGRPAENLFHLSVIPPDVEPSVAYGLPLPLLPDYTNTTALTVVSGHPGRTTISGSIYDIAPSVPGFEPGTNTTETISLDAQGTPSVTSEAINGGNEFLDFDPFTPGEQSLPSVDVNGNPRRVGSSIDIGAVERQDG